MKIALAVTKLTGGVSRSCLEFITAIQKVDRKNSYIVFTPGEVFPVKLNKNFRVVEIKSGLCGKNALAPEFSWMQLELPSILRKEKVDILHSLYYPLPLAYSCKTIITMHDLSFTRKMPIGHPPIFSRAISKWMAVSAKIADRIIAPSCFTRKDIEKRIGVSEKKITCVPWGVSNQFCRLNDTKLLETYRCKYGLGERNILSVNELIPRKNIIRLIKAFNKIKKRVPHDLVIVGNRNYPELYEGFYSEVDELISRLKVEKRIKLLRDLSEKDLLYLYNCANIFVYPSLFEGFGLPALEAMACGVPVICSKTSALPETAGGAAVLMEPYRIDSLADVMLSLINNEKEKDRLIRLGFSRIKELTWEVTARKTLEVYTEVFDEN